MYNSLFKSKKRQIEIALANTFQLDRLITLLGFKTDTVAIHHHLKHFPANSYTLKFSGTFTL